LSIFMIMAILAIFTSRSSGNENEWGTAYPATSVEFARRRLLGRAGGQANFRDATSSDPPPVTASGGLR
jgi:hypothetical protein